MPFDCQHIVMLKRYLWKTNENKTTTKNHPRNPTRTGEHVSIEVKLTKESHQQSVDKDLSDLTEQLE